MTPSLSDMNPNPARVIQRIDEVLQGAAKSSAVSHIGRALNELAVASMAVEGSPLPATPPTQDNPVAWALHQAQSWAHKAMRELTKLTETADTRTLILMHRSGQKEQDTVRQWQGRLQDWDSPFTNNDQTSVWDAIRAGKTSGQWNGGTWELR